jgi:hypothetical protein
VTTTRSTEGDTGKLLGGYEKPARNSDVMIPLTDNRYAAVNCTQNSSSSWHSPEDSSLEETHVFTEENLPNSDLLGTWTTSSAPNYFDYFNLDYTWLKQLWLWISWKVDYLTWTTDWTTLAYTTWLWLLDFDYLTLTTWLWLLDFDYLTLTTWLRL